MIHFRSIIVLAMLATTTGLANQGASASENVLRWRFQPGTKFHVLMTSSRDFDMKGKADQIRTKIHSLTDMMYCVEAVDDNGTAQITLSYKRMRLKIQSPDGNVNVDSAEDLQNWPANSSTQMKRIKEIIPNIQYRISVDNRGKVLSIMTNDKSFQSTKQIFPWISKHLDEEGIRQTLKSVFLVLPEAPLVIGDTWDTTLKIPLPGSTFHKAHIKYRFEGSSRYKNKVLEKITTKATLELSKKPPEISAKIVSQENQGTIYFDRDAGRLVESETLLRITNEYTYEGRIAREKLTTMNKVKINPILLDKPVGRVGRTQ